VLRLPTGPRPAGSRSDRLTGHHGRQACPHQDAGATDRPHPSAGATDRPHQDAGATTEPSSRGAGRPM